MDKLREALVARINNYFQMGGVFNPEQMDHVKVRQLLLDCREFLATPSEPQASEPRCLVTGNPCGTDTITPGHPCQCANCKPQASEPRTYKGDLHKDLLDDDFALEYFKACAIEGALPVALREFREALLHDEPQ